MLQKRLLKREFCSQNEQSTKRGAEETYELSNSRGEMRRVGPFRHLQLRLTRNKIVSSKYFLL